MLAAGGAPAPQDNVDADFLAAILRDVPIAPAPPALGPLPPLPAQQQAFSPLAQQQSMQAAVGQPVLGGAGAGGMQLPLPQGAWPSNFVPM